MVEGEVCLFAKFGLLTVSFSLVFFNRSKTFSVFSGAIRSLKLRHTQYLRIIYYWVVAKKSCKAPAHSPLSRNIFGLSKESSSTYVVSIGDFLCLYFWEIDRRVTKPAISVIDVSRGLQFLPPKTSTNVNLQIRSG